MKLTFVIAAAAAALVIAAPSNAGGTRWEKLSLSERHKLVAANITHYRSTVQWWLHRRSTVRGPLARFVPSKFCPALGIHAPRPVCGSGQRLVRAVKVLRRLDAVIAAHAIPDAYADWYASVRFVERVFPGTSAWVWACSGSEGGHGIWIWNGGAPHSSPYHGSGAGGWMQFLDSTFWNNVDGAFAEARARGFHIPAAARSYTSSLGQAVTAAYMDWRGWSGQWYGAAC